MPKDQSPELTKFYRAWLKWAGREAKNSNWFLTSKFDTHVGLCHAVEKWAGKNKSKSGNDLRFEMKQQFISAGYDSVYPFGGANWVRDMHRGAAHLCPSRLAWVRSHIPAEEVSEPLVQRLKGFFKKI